MPEAQWAFLVDIIGDLCRVLIFYMYTTSLKGAKTHSESKSSQNETKTTQKSDSGDDEESDQPNSLLRRRSTALDLSF